MRVFALLNVLLFRVSDNRGDSNGQNLTAAGLELPHGDHLRALVYTEMVSVHRKESEMSETEKRITINSEICGGRPCIRGMRIRVTDILDLFANGLSAQEILDEMPDLEMEDLKAALKYASKKLDHPVIAA